MHILVCKPENFEIIEPINPTEVITFAQGISKKNLNTQHAGFCKALTKNKQTIDFVPTKKELPEQTFVRDVCFEINNIIFICKMKEPIRQQEAKAVHQYLLTQEFSKNKQFVEMEHCIEGGDVFVCEKNIFIGVGNRTTKEAVNQLKTYLPEYKIHMINLTKESLHLDCALGILDNKTAFVHKIGIDKKGYALLEKHFEEILEITSEENDKLATNFLRTDNIVFCNKHCERINNLIKERGYKIVPLEFSELCKLGGCFRCCVQTIE